MAKLLAGLVGFGGKATIGVAAKGGNATERAKT